ncbi:MAG: AAA family ATPase [Vampirovibrionia bacterium]
MSIEQSVKNISDLAKSLNETFYERQEEVRILLLALCAREHVFFLGKAGVAKSMIIEAISKSTDCSYFESLLCKDSKADQLFGPFKISDLKKDMRNRNTDNMLPEAQLVFLDECFKANSTVLNNLLKIMNEKKFYNNGQWNDLPLKSLFGASNELPQDKSLKALYDRFLFRKEVKSIHSGKNFLSLMKSNISLNSLPKVSWKDFDSIYEASKTVKDCDKVIESLYKIKKQIGITSDRKCLKAYRAMKVAAVLSGRDKVCQKDLMILRHIFWDTPSEEAEVTAAVGAFVGSKVKDALSLVGRFLSELGLDPNLVKDSEDVIKAIKKLANESNVSILSNARRSCSSFQEELDLMAEEDDDCSEIAGSFSDYWQELQNSLKSAIGL